MRSKNHSVWMTCLSAGMAMSLAGSVLAQAQPEKKPAAQPTKAPAKVEQPKGAQPAVDPAMAAMMAAAAPGENHKLLAKFEGEWTGAVKMWMAPGQTPTESTSSAHQKVEMGGRYLYSHIDGEFMGDKFKGVRVIGYNNVLKKFQSSWIDNMGTGIETASGTYDAATKTYAFSGEMTCPEKGGTVTCRSTIQWTGDNTFVEKMYAPGPDGKEFLTMEISCKRGSAKSEADKHDGDKHEGKEKGKGK